MQPAQERIAWEVFDSLDQNLRHHLRQADNIVRVMISDMLLHGIKGEDAREFLRERVQELGEINRAIAEKEAKGNRATKRMESA